MTLSGDSFEVYLVIYDLSKGMARQLSTQFLGPAYAIDAIPHSGVVVYGQEYFFGAGIQSESPALFRQMTGMMPIQTIYLGRTTVSQAEFEQWCHQQQQEQQTNHGRFSAQTYDLLHCNCNHFAHTAAIEGLRMSTGVPDWVLQVPQRFLASPMGQMVRPLLENMQLRAPVDGAHVISASSSSVAAPPPNPWTNLGNSKETKRSSSLKKEIPSHLLLDSFSKPLVSKDDKTVSMCIPKIISSQTTSTKDGDSMANNEIQEFLHQCQTKLANQKTESLVLLLSLEDHVRLGQILHACLQEQRVVTFSLMLLRLLVLGSQQGEAGGQDNTVRVAYQDCLDWIRSSLQTDLELLSSTPARTMAWLVLSNCASGSVFWQLPQQQLQEEEAENEEEEKEFWIQAGITALQDAANSVRQAAAAYLYNVTLRLPPPTLTTDEDGWNGTNVSLLCATLERLAEETDDTTRLRRVMAAGRILIPVQTNLPRAPAIELAKNLGLEESLRQEATRLVHAKPGTDAETCAKLASELDAILSAHAA